MKSVLLLCLALVWASQSQARLILPAPAPPVHLRDLDGRPMDLASLAGKVVLVDFWATWCGPCREEAPLLKGLQDRYRDRGLRVLGLSLDDNAAPVRKFRREKGLNYPVALADLTTTARFGGVLGLPTLFLVDRSGRIVMERQGEIDFKKFTQELEKTLGPSNQ